MPVLINKQDDTAENLSEEQAQAAVQNGTHDVPLLDPEGETVYANYKDLSSLLKQGHKQPAAAQLQDLLDNTKYSTTSEQLKTGLEGAASAATFGLSTAAERVLGVNPKDIQKRREVNPGSHALGEAAGLLGSLATGIGEGALLGKAAEAIVPAIGANFAGRVGSTAAKSAIENMIFTGGDEASKLFSSDPHQSIETALTDIGLSAALGGSIGGGFGATSELWKMGPGKKLEQFLGAIKNRADGLPTELKNAAGIHIPPELEAALTGNPEAERVFQTLQESNSSAGIKVQDTLNKFRTEANEATLSSLGKTSADLDAIHSMSDYDTGKSIKDMITRRMSEIVEPVSKKYEEFAEKFKQTPLSPELKTDIANSVASKVSELGLEKASSDTQLKAANKFLQALSKQDNVNDLKLLATNLTEEHPFGSETYRIGKVLKNIVTDAQDTALTNEMMEKAPQLLGDYASTKEAYKGIKNLIDDLNDRLHVGKSYGPGSFIKNIRDAAPEDIIKRLNPKGDVELQALLQKSFPEASNAVRANELNKLLKSSMINGNLSTKKLFNNIDRLSPEMKSFVLDEEQMKRIGALKDLINRIPTRANPSGSAKTLDKLWNYMPASAAGMAAMFLGHSPIAGWALGHIAQYASREIPDAARMAMLKFLGSSSELSSEGFQAMSKLIAASIKGEKLLDNGIKNVFGTGGKVIQFPASTSIKTLEEQVKRVADNDPKQQEELMSVGGKAGHYVPDHAGALALTASRNLQYLASLRPVETPLSPLDNKQVPNSEQQANYQRALTIAEQPLVVLNAVKNGSITVHDIAHLKNLYPALYDRMSQKLMNQLVENASNSKQLPYSTKLGISSFMTRALDSSMSIESLNSIQQSFQTMPQHMMNQNMDKLNKMPNLYQTPTQSREIHKNSRH